jgi:hypothetical protein
LGFFWNKIQIRTKVGRGFNMKPLKGVPRRRAVQEGGAKEKRAEETLGRTSYFICVYNHPDCTAWIH